MSGFVEPEHDCRACPRLAQFRRANRAAEPHWHNGPVAAFGPLDARLLIVGLAPGLRGANRTGRPFTGDWAGDLLYPTLLSFGFAKGNYAASADDGLSLTDCRITNAVRCVPPANKPIGAEAAACKQYLTSEIAAMERLRVVLALGGLAHGALCGIFNLRKSRHKFAHGARHALDGERVLMNSYHCSRYNTNTGRLSEAMFHRVFKDIRGILEA